MSNEKVQEEKHSSFWTQLPSQLFHMHINVILGAFIKKKMPLLWSLISRLFINYSYQAIWLSSYFTSHCIYTLFLRNTKYLCSLLYIYSEYMWVKISPLRNILKRTSWVLAFHWNSTDCSKVWNIRNIQLKFKIYDCFNSAYYISIKWKFVIHDKEEL